MSMTDGGDPTPLSLDDNNVLFEPLPLAVGSGTAVAATEAAPAKAKKPRTKKPAAATAGVAAGAGAGSGAPATKKVRKAADAAPAPARAPKRAKTDTADAEDRESYDEDAEQEAKEAARENKDKDVREEKQHLLTQLQGWVSEGKISAALIANLTVKANTLETLYDAYYGACEELGIACDGVVEDTEAEDEEEASEEREKARMLAQLEAWWADGSVARPRKPITAAAAFETVEAAYDKAAAKLGLDGELEARDMSEAAHEAAAFTTKQEEAAARRRRREVMWQLLQTWWKDEMVDPPVPELTVLSSYKDVEDVFNDACAELGDDPAAVLAASTPAAPSATAAAAEPTTTASGRPARTRRAPPPDPYTLARFKEQQAQQEAADKKVMLGELAAFVAQGLYSDTADDAAIPLKRLKDMSFNRVHQEYQRVCDLLNIEDEDEDSVDDEDHGDGEGSEGSEDGGDGDGEGGDDDEDTDSEYEGSTGQDDGDDDDDDDGDEDSESEYEEDPPAKPTGGKRQRPIVVDSDVE